MAAGFKINNNFPLNPAGPSGSSGRSGWSGTSGQMGQSGFSGFSGQDGDGRSGVSGTSGYSGANGSGVSGYSGSSGLSGTSGTSGLSGFSSPSGQSGYSGASTSGWSGYSGQSGISGPSGISAFSGASGASGLSGISGLSGLSGTSGASGFSGGSGISGPSGISGQSGTSGTSGVSGFSGASGLSGTSGTSGASGLVGVSGYSGASGLSGISGYSGSSGSSGTSGYSGTLGLSGTSGQSGFSGTSGALGLSGTSGISGLSGTSGTSGVSGFSGASGLSGTSGTSGVSGLGLSGLSGFSGVIGASGFSGASGKSGFSGASGFSGGGGNAFISGTSHHLQLIQSSGVLGDSIIQQLTGTSGFSGLVVNGSSVNSTLSINPSTYIGAPVTVSFTATGGATWTPPAGVTSVTVECWAGGGGGGGSGGGNGGGGGGGGGYAKSVIAVTVGTTYQIDVGPGGAGGSTAGGGVAGIGSSNSDFGTLSTTLVSARGSAGGAGGTAGGGGGSTSGSNVGTIVVNGIPGNGHTGTTGGAGGAAGNGGAGGSAGASGSIPGGGGGGGTVTGAGGGGARGQVNLTYSPLVPLPDVNLNDVNGQTNSRFNASGDPEVRQIAFSGMSGYSGYAGASVQVYDQVSGMSLISDNGKPFRQILSSRRNVLHNPRFDIWQRGLAFGSLNNVNTTYADRWKFCATAAAPNMFIQQVGAIALPGGNNCFQIVPQATQGSIASGTIIQLYQVIEGINVIQLKDNWITFSFYAYTNVAGTYAAWLQTGTGAKSYCWDWIVTLTNQWVRYQFSVLLDSSVATGLAYDNTAGLLVGLSISAGATFNTAPTTPAWVTAGTGYATSNLTSSTNTFLSSTSNAMYITNCQLEASPYMTEFDYVGADIDTKDCYRYYWNYAQIAGGYYSNGMSFAGTGAIGVIQFPVVMRTTPTCTPLGPTQYYVLNGGAAGVVTTNLVADVLTPNSLRWQAVVAGGLTAGQATLLLDHGLANTGFPLSADL